MYNYANSVTSDVTTYVDISNYYQLIKTNPDNQGKIQILRSIDKASNKALYDTLKSSLPVYTVNATFSGKKSFKELIGPSNYIYFDIDDLKSEIEFSNTFQELRCFSFIDAIWRSPGGKGIGFTVKIKDSYPAKDFNKVWDYISGLLSDFPLDKKCRNINRLNYISFDPDLHQNENTIPLEFPDGFFLSIDSNENLHNIVSISKNSVVIETRMCKNGDIETILPTLDNISKGWKFKETFTMDKDFEVHKDGYKTVKCFLPIKKIRVGNRFKTLRTYTINLVYLNPDKGSKDVLRLLKIINHGHCVAPLEEKELTSIINYTFNLKKEGKLMPYYNEKKIKFNEKSKLSIKDKQSIAGKAMGKIKSDRTYGKLYNAMIELKEECIKVSQKTISIRSGVHINTVNRYYKNLKLDVKPNEFAH